MPDTDIYRSAFALISQPLVAVSGEYIEYMNAPAIELSQRDLTGSHVSALFPSHITNIQAESFVTTAFIGTKSCAVNVAASGKTRVCVLTPKTNSHAHSSAVFARLCTSLSNIRFASSCISIVGENTGDEKLLGYVSALNRSYNSIKRTVDNMSTLSLLERGELPFYPEAFDVTLLCSDIIDTLSFALRREGLSISLHAEEHLRFIADRGLFEQLLMNLLSNSIEHCGERGHISVSLLRDQKHLILGVTDDGCGIEADMLPGIFERYRQSQGLSSADTGSGMGLAIVRGIAEKHGGAVIIESKGKGKGTTVRVMLSGDLTPSTRFTDVFPAEHQLMKKVLTEFADILPDEAYSSISED